MGNKKGYWAGKKNPKYTHGFCGTRAYSIWLGMMRRCFNERTDLYKYYGARGITVCERWRHIENFVEDMGEPAKGLSLERKDNAGNYCLENCKWATRAEQASNTRAVIFLELNGQRLSLSEWARRLNLPFTTIRNRYKQGWSVERILNPQREKPYPGSKRL